MWMNGDNNPSIPSCQYIKGVMGGAFTFLILIFDNFVLLPYVRTWE
jgi:hypothetical protein